MTAQSDRSICSYIKANFWIILVDLVGAGLLLSLLLTASGAPVLREFMFVLLTIVPVMAVLSIVILQRPQPSPAPVMNKPIATRKVIICPRPIDQRSA